MNRTNPSAIKNFFPLPNIIFSLGLSAGEIAVYSYLMFVEDRRTYQCWPSYKTIGSAIGMSENTVRKYVGQLEEKSFITTEPTSVITKTGMKRNGNLLYTILPIQTAVEAYYEKQLRKAEDENEKRRIASILKRRTHATAEESA